MIALAANGSEILLRLLETEPVALDYVKCPLSPNSRQEVAAFRPYRPVLLHGWGPDFWIGQRHVPDPELLRELMATSESPYLSTHLDVQAGDLDQGFTPALAFSRIVENVGKLRANTGGEILLENIPYFPWGRSEADVVMPGFIQDALRLSGAHFLLDLAHARVSAWHIGWDYRTYLESLPLERVTEIHLSRPRLEADGMRDRHLPLEEEDYALLQDLLPRLPGLKTVALEYGGLKDVELQGMTIRRNDPDALRAQLLQLNTHLEAFDVA